MDTRCLVTFFIIITLTADVQPQLFDFFQGIQPYFQSTTLKPIWYYETTKRPKTRRPTTKKDEEDSRETRAKPRRKTTASFIENTTPKTRRTKGPENDVNLTNGIVEKGFQKDVVIDNQIHKYDNGFYRPESTTRRNYYNTENPYRTQSPFLNVPGVRPAAVDVNRPPITNRPVTQKPYIVAYPKPTAPGAVVFKEDDVAPNVVVGVDEDAMGLAERRRYIELAERMCDKYKSLNVKHVEAIPLVPSPEPIKVNVSSCAPTTIPLVVGGKVVTIKEFPHMALMGWLKLQGRGYSWKCGGSLISDQYVLTAGHCSYQERDNSVVTGPPRAVQLGSSYLDDPGALVVKVLSVIRHPNYKLPKSYYDMAIVKLVRPVTFSEVIKPACLGEAPPVGQPIIATGWGRTEFGGDQSLELRSVSLPIWGLEECREVLGTSRKLPNGVSGASQICAGEKRGGKDTCQGDSGGPGQVQDGCVWRVVAVTSLGRSCGAPHTPGLYAKVQRVFIAATVFGQKTGDENGNNNEKNTNNNDRNTNNNDRNLNNNNRNINNNNRNINNNDRSINNNNRNINNNGNSNNNGYTENYTGTNRNPNTNTNNNRNTNNNSNNRNTNSYVSTDNPYNRNNNNNANINNNYNNRNINNDNIYYPNDENTFSNRPDRIDVYNQNVSFNNNGNRNNNRNRNNNDRDFNSNYSNNNDRNYNNDNLYNNRQTQGFNYYSTPRIWWTR